MKRHRTEPPDAGRAAAAATRARSPHQARRRRLELSEAARSALGPVLAFLSHAIPHGEHQEIESWKNQHQQQQQQQEEEEGYSVAKLLAHHEEGTQKFRKDSKMDELEKAKDYDGVFRWMKDRAREHEDERRREWRNEDRRRSDAAWADPPGIFLGHPDDDRDRISGSTLFLLSFYVTVWPEVTADEARAFLKREVSGNYLYSRESTQEALDKFRSGREEVDEKRRTLDRCDPSHPDNRRVLLEMFKTEPYPCGLVGIPRSKVVDVLEFGLELDVEGTTSFCEAVQKMRAKDRGEYTPGVCLTVLMAVEAGDPDLPTDIPGSLAKPRRWVKVKRGSEGADWSETDEFVMETILPSLRTGELWRVFLWDKDKMDISDYLYDHLALNNHRALERHLERYEVPSEWVMLTLASKLRYLAPAIYDVDGLEEAIHDVVSKLSDFDAVFAKCFEKVG